MKKLNTQDMSIISALRCNARESLSMVGKNLNIPHSTIHDKVKAYELNIIKKHTSILDFSKMGYECRATIALKLAKYQTKELHDFIRSKKEVNNAYEINHGYDLLMECIFRSRTDLKMFMDELEEKFPLQEKHIFEMYNDLKRESFLENQEAHAGKEAM